MMRKLILYTVLLFALSSILAGCGYYQLFDGVDPDDYEVVIAVINKDTGEVFDTIVYPDDLEDK